MRTIIAVLLCGFIAVGFLESCEKDNGNMVDYTDSINITEYSWKLSYLKINGVKDIPKTGYTLEFNSDSIFIMNFSVNMAGGYYQIKKKGEIEFFNYHAFTEKCCDSEFDQKLENSLVETNSYKVLGNDLVLTGDIVELRFVKQDSP